MWSRLDGLAVYDLHVTFNPDGSSDLLVKVCGQRDDGTVDRHELHRVVPGFRVACPFGWEEFAESPGYTDGVADSLAASVRVEFARLELPVMA